MEENSSREEKKSRVEWSCHKQCWLCKVCSSQENNCRYPRKKSDRAIESGFAVIQKNTETVIVTRHRHRNGLLLGRTTRAFDFALL